MNTRRAGLLAALGCLLGVFACGDIAATNPYDPAAPATVRSPGRLVGVVQLGRAIDRPALPSVEIRVTLLDDGPDGGVGETFHPNAEGRFAISDLVPGRYAVEASLAGYQGERRVAEVPLGGVADLGTISLTHDASDAETAVPFRVRVTLRDRETHEGTLVALRVAGRDVPFATTLTDSAGDAVLQASPVERYRLRIDRPGWALSGETGLYAWQPDARGEHPDGGFFTDTERPGEPLAFELLPEPLDGRIEVTAHVGPDWIPLNQRKATVRIDGPRTLEQAVEEGSSASLSGLPPGTYVVSLERPGFSSWRQAVTLDLAQRAAAFPDAAIDLTDLSSADLDLRGVIVSACELRGRRLHDAHLSRAYLTGNLGPETPEGCARCTSAETCAAVDLAGADLGEAEFEGVTGAQDVSFRNASLVGARLRGVDLSGADFGNANLAAADMSCRDAMTCTRLAGAHLAGANLASARLGGALLGDPVSPLPSPPCPNVDPGAPESSPFLATSFANTDLSRADLAGLDLRGAIFSGTRLLGANLAGACLAGQRLVLVDLSEAVLDGADLTGFNGTLSVLDDTSLRGTRLDDAALVGAVLQRADFRPGCDDPYPHVEDGQGYSDRCDAAGGLDPRCCRTTARRATFAGTNLASAVLNDAILTDADFLGATFGQALGAEANSSAAFAELTRANLAQVDFAGTELSGAILDEANLRGVGLESSYLHESSMRGAFLHRARLAGNDTLENVDLTGAIFEEADLQDVVITGADLSFAWLVGANLQRAYIADSVIESARLDRADLRDATFGEPRPVIEGRPDNEPPRRAGEVRLTGSDLRGVDLSGARLARLTSDAPLGNARMIHTEIVDSDLRGLSWDVPTIRDLTIRRSDLTGAALRGGESDGNGALAFSLLDSTFDDAVLAMDLGPDSHLDRTSFAGSTLRGTWTDVTSEDSRFLDTDVIVQSTGLTWVSEEMHGGHLGGRISRPVALRVRFVDVGFFDPAELGQPEPPQRMVFDRGPAQTSLEFRQTTPRAEDDDGPPRPRLENGDFRATFSGLLDAPTRGGDDSGEDDALFDVDLSGSRFEGVHLPGVRFAASTLRDTRWRRSSVETFFAPFPHGAGAPEFDGDQSGLTMDGVRWLGEFQGELYENGDLATGATFVAGAFRFSCVERALWAPALTASRPLGPLLPSDEFEGVAPLLSVASDLRRLGLPANASLHLRTRPLPAAQMPAHLRLPGDAGREYGTNVAGLDFAGLYFAAPPGFAEGFAPVGADLRWLCNPGAARWAGANLAQAILCERDRAAYAGAEGLDEALFDPDCGAVPLCPELDVLCEADWPGCLPDELTCADGACQPAGFACDGRRDCADGSDEADCDCGADAFACGGDAGTCLPAAARCDGRSDCEDATDERDCDACHAWGDQEGPAFEIPCEDPPPECNGGPLCSPACVPGSWMNDDRDQCPDHVDEPIREHDPARCADRCPDTGACVTAAQRCDGFLNCADASDEALCPLARTNNYAVYATAGLLCRPRFGDRTPARCDGVPDCVDGYDEDPVICAVESARLPCGSVPGHFDCPDGTGCVLPEAVCDGVEDCLSGDDEPFECLPR